MKSLPALLAALATTLLATCACRHPADSTPAAAAPQLGADLVAEYRERAAPAEVRRYEKLAAAPDAESRTHAVEMVLFALSDQELYGLGVTQVQQGDELDWAIAWSTDSEADSAAVEAALRRVGVSGFASCGLGMAGWYVPRDDFFRAQAALLADETVRARRIDVVQPRLTRQMR